MRYLILLILLTLLILLYLWVNRILQNFLSLPKLKLKQLEEDHANLLRKDSNQKSENKALSEKAESVVELYEITKEVCNSLEEDAVFDIFNEKLNDYIKFKEIRFIKQDLDYQLYKDNLVFPLDIGIKPTYFLVAEGVAKEEEEKFYILAQQFLLGFKRAAFYRRIQDLAIHDTLTGLLTRRYFLERFKEEIKRAEKLKFRFSFLMIDIDHFKDCNDRYGHLVGDVALKEIAGAIKDNTRQIDIVGRYGGEEFSVILSETAKEGAINASSRILKSVEEKKIRAYDEELGLTISIGLAEYPEDGKQIVQLIDNADEALYKAKHAGGNMICVY